MLSNFYGYFRQEMPQIGRLSKVLKKLHRIDIIQMLTTFNDDPGLLKMIDNW